MEKQCSKLTSEGVATVLRMYRDVCIAENAFINDCNHYNDNYEQRRIAFEQVLELADLDEDALSRAWSIRREIARQTWHLTLDQHGANKYVRLDKEK